MRSFFSIFLVSTSLLSLSLQAESVDTQSYRAFSNPFIQASKKASPSVVSIRTEIKAERLKERFEERAGQYGQVVPDEFWEHFFGFPNLPNAPKTERRPEYIYGSGFLVSNDGYILTNNHMIENGSKIKVQLPDGNELEAKKIGADSATDIALIKVEGNNLPYLTLADSSKVEIGEWVMAIGNPLGLRASVTSGVISAKGRSDLDITLVEEFFQTDATINQGNSGGPLINLNGEVVGMNTAIATNTGGSMGIGFAISSNLLKEVMKELIEHGKLTRGFLGIGLQPLDGELAPAFGLDKPQGALVSEVQKGTPAEKAGILSGDIITHINGNVIETAGSLRKYIALLRPEQKVEITLLRAGKSIKLSAVIGTAPEKSEPNEMTDDFGMSLEAITPEVAKTYKLASTQGLLVLQIDPLGAAYAAGIRPGNVIISVNGTPVNTLEEFSSICSSLDKGKKALIQLRIGTHTKYTSLTIE